MTLLSQVLHAVAHTPELKRPHTVVTFDVWVEYPGSGWYEMCENAGVPGYDGVNPAWAWELDDVLCCSRDTRCGERAVHS